MITTKSMQIKENKESLIFQTIIIFCHLLNILNEKIIHQFSFKLVKMYLMFSFFTRIQSPLWIHSILMQIDCQMLDFLDINQSFWIMKDMISLLMEYSQVNLLIFRILYMSFYIEWLHKQNDNYFKKRNNNKIAVYYLATFY